MKIKKADATEKLFGGVDETPVQKSQRFDRYKEALATMPAAMVDNAGQTVAGNLRIANTATTDTGQRLIQIEKIEDASARMKSLLRDDTINKALGADQVAGIQQALGQTITKDISLTSPVSTGLVLYDLKAPAEELVPVETPLRNRFPRTRGVGTAFHYKQITGFSNAQTGSGLPLLHPGITDTTQTNFAVAGSANALYYNRPPKISYTGADVTASYFQFGLSDEVTWSAFFAGQGFQDPRSLSQTSTMYASFLAEERMTVYGRGTAGNGYSGQLTAPATVAVTPSTTGGALPAGTTYFVAVAATSGFGTTAATSSASVTTTGTTGSIAVAWSPVPGATGYQVYVSSTANTPATEFFVGATGAYSGAFTNATTVTTAAFTVVGPVPTSGATAPTANTSAQTVGYDGIIPVTLGPSSGYVASLNGKFSTSSPGTEFQKAFGAMYAANLANPDCILLGAQDRTTLSDLLKGSSSTGFRVVIDADGAGGHQLGQIVTAIQNESTGKVVDLEVHPYWPQGVASIITNTLPFPNSEVPSCWEYRNVQDYMGINWPSMQLSYDFSTYWFGTFFCHAPAWQGAITGIQAG
jgi:hypothetical protein